MLRWLSVIVESDRIIHGQPLDLTEQLNAMAAQGWQVRFVLPNGINRWAVICSRED